MQQCNVHIFLSSISFACSNPRRIFHSPFRSQSFLFRFLVPGQSHNPVCLPLVVGLTAKLFSKIYDEIVSKLFDFVSSHVATVLSSQLSSILVWFFGGPNPNRKKRIRTYVHGSDHWGHQESCGPFWPFVSFVQGNLKCPGACHTRMLSPGHYWLYRECPCWQLNYTRLLPGTHFHFSHFKF